MSFTLLSCEHGGNQIPKEYAPFFLKQQSVINSHRGIDFGTLHLFHEIAPHFDFALSNELCRLLIEFNRSLHHPNLFSEYSKHFNQVAKKTLINDYYKPYRDAYEKKISEQIHQKKHFHLSLHSFTPVLNEKERNCDIGLLYNPKNPLEVVIVQQLKHHFQNAGFKVRLNYPYKGTADGFTTYLRKKFPVNYAGIELELNQKHCIDNVFNKHLLGAVKNTVLSLSF